MCACVYGMNWKYVLRWHSHIIMSSFRAMPVLYTRILKPFEDSEPTGIQVDIAGHESGSADSREARFLGVTDICSGHLLEC